MRGTPADAAVAERIRRAAQAAGMSQSEVARRLKMQPGTVSRYWNGNRKLPTEFVARFAALVGMSEEELWHGPAAAAVPENRGLIALVSADRPERLSNAALVAAIERLIREVKERLGE